MIDSVTILKNAFKASTITKTSFTETNFVGWKEKPIAKIAVDAVKLGKKDVLDSLLAAAVITQKQYNNFITQIT